MLYQQGDVLFKSVDKLPKTAKLMKRKGPVIVAEGETTGHAHKILDEVKAFLDEKDKTMFVEGPFTVTHEEHNPVSVPDGLYMVDKVREFDHFSEEARRVRD